MSIPSAAMWVGTVLFAGAFALSLLAGFEPRISHNAAEVALLGTMFEGILEGVPGTRSRAAAVATLVIGVLAQVFGSPILHLLSYATSGWYALEVRRPLDRSPWPVLAATAFAVTQSPLVFGPIFAVTAVSLGRAAPPPDTPKAWRHELEVLGGVFLTTATVTMALGKPLPPLIAFVVFAVAVFRNGRALPLPVHIAVHGAVLAQVFACFAHSVAHSTFAAGCAVALEATAIVGIAMFLPKNSRYVLALTLAGLFLGCGGFLEMTVPIAFLHWLAFLPSAIFVAIGLKQAGHATQK